VGFRRANLNSAGRKRSSNQEKDSSTLIAPMRTDRRGALRAAETRIVSTQYRKSKTRHSTVTAPGSYKRDIVLYKKNKIRYPKGAKINRQDGSKQAC
jgi:hypothetical protein